MNEHDTINRQTTDITIGDYTITNVADANGRQIGIIIGQDDQYTIIGNCIQKPETSNDKWIAIQQLAEANGDNQLGEAAKTMFQKELHELLIEVLA